MVFYVFSIGAMVTIVGKQLSKLGVPKFSPKILYFVEMTV